MSPDLPPERLHGPWEIAALLSCMIALAGLLMIMWAFWVSAHNYGL